MPRSPSSSDNGHSPLSPSKSSRWLQCRASVGLIERLHREGRLPRDETSKYAQEGKLAHKFAEDLLRGKKVRIPDSEMDEHVRGYVTFVHDRRKEMESAQMFVEQRVALYYALDQKGTADVILLSGSGITIVDLKYGVGITVEAVRNSQLAIYLKSWLVARKMKLPPSATVKLYIYQPRAWDGHFVRKWVITVAELNAFAQSIGDVAQDIMLDPDGQPYHADEDTTCRFCQAKSLCKHYAAHLLGDLPTEAEQTMELAELSEPLLSTKEFPAAETLTDNQIARLLRVRGALGDWLDSVHEYARARYGDKLPIPGTKQVKGRTQRQWTDAEKAATELRKIFREKDLFVRELVSPAQVDKLMKKQDISPRIRLRVEKCVTRQEGEALVVHESDPRPAINQDIDDLLL